MTLAQPGPWERRPGSSRARRSSRFHRWGRRRRGYRYPTAGALPESERRDALRFPALRATGRADVAGAVGRLAAGGWRLAAGGWRLAAGGHLKVTAGAAPRAARSSPRSRASGSCSGSPGRPRP
ncbi:hypothetical protein CKO22_16725 [Thiococcus pfennigii]|nr:hypothetical protein [Thiococcus pfennigii]